MSNDLLAPALLPIPLAALGLVFGSFVTALSYRLPRGQSIAHGRSRCPACDHVLGAADLVPVFSWIAQGGACRHCRAKISARYPLIEMLSGGLFVAAGVLTAGDPVHLLILLAMTPVLLALAVIDLENARLPNILLGLLAVLACAWRWAGDGELLTGGLTAGAATVVGLGLNAAHKAVTGRSGLGMGDTKLFAVAGLALAVGPFLFFVALAGLLGVLTSLAVHRRTRGWNFPFGPAIAAAFWITLSSGESLVNQLLTFRLG